VRELTQIKLIDFMDLNIILIAGKNMTWLLKKIKTISFFRKVIETITD